MACCTNDDAYVEAINRTRKRRVIAKLEPGAADEPLLCHMRLRSPEVGVDLVRNERQPVCGDAQITRCQLMLSTRMQRNLAHVGVNSQPAEERPLLGGCNPVADRHVRSATADQLEQDSERDANVLPVRDN